MRRPLLAAIVALAAALAIPAFAVAATEPPLPAARLVDAGFSPEVQTSTPLLPVGVHIAGVDVGGLQADSATIFVRAAFAQPLTLMLGSKRVLVSPADLGVVALADRAVRRALASASGSSVPLEVRVPGAAVRTLVARLAAGYDRTAVSRGLALRNFHPVLTSGVSGRKLDRPGAVAAISQALAAGTQTPVVLPITEIAPAAAPAGSTQLILVRRASNTLELFDGVKLVRTFGVATGQPAYPTPLGTFSIISKKRDPWWYPPPSPWAKDKAAVPPGPGNPLGTRWMGLSEPLVGIHGTPDAASIGYSRSHGCVRMRIDQAEWLFEHVSIGTRVMIVPA